MQKINSITTDGNNNINIQDVNGSTINLNITDNKAIEEFIAAHKAQTAEMLALLQEKQEPALQQFADKIYNIQKIETANFETGGGKVDIQNVETVNISKVEENRASKYVKYLLLFFVLPGAFVFLMYWYFVLSQPFSMTVTVNETTLVPALPFTEGTLSLQYADKTEELQIEKEAIFKQIPANLKGETAHLLFVAEGYITIDTNITLGQSLQIPIRRNNSLGIISGMVKDEDNQPVSGVSLSVKGITTTSDATGNFRIKIPYPQQATEQRLKAFKEGYDLWDRTFPVIPDVATSIILRKKE